MISILPGRVHGEVEAVLVHINVNVQPVMEDVPDQLVLVQCPRGKFQDHLHSIQQGGDQDGQKEAGDRAFGDHGPQKLASREATQLSEIVLG